MIIGIFLRSRFLEKCLAQKVSIAGKKVTPFTNEHSLFANEIFFRHKKGTLFTFAYIVRKSESPTW